MERRGEKEKAGRRSRWLETSPGAARSSAGTWGSGGQGQAGHSCGFPGMGGVSGQLGVPPARRTCYTLCWMEGKAS